MALGDRGLEAPIKVSDLRAPSATVEITAFAGGGQASATVINTSWNVVTVCATNGDSVKLPASFRVNTLVYIKNNGAASCDVFPGSGDDLGQGANTAEALPAGESVAYIATVENTTWTVSIVHPVVAEVNDLTDAVTWDNIPDANVPQSAVTQHQAALSIAASQLTGLDLADNSDVVSAANTDRFALVANGTTGYVGRLLVEADISDLQSYLTSEVNDLSAAVTWANVPQANIPDPLLLGDGSAAAPSYSFSATGQEDVGFYRSTTDEVSLALGGVAQAHWAFATTGISGIGSDRPAMLYASASATVPTLTPRNDDSNTGIGRNDPDELSLIAGGVEMARLAETGSAATDQVIIAPGRTAGAAATPALAFGDGNTGFYEAADNVLRATIAGTDHWVWLTTFFQGAINNGPALLDAASSATVPSFLFSGDSDTGIGRAASDKLSLISGGVEGLRLVEASSGVIQVPQAQLGITAFATGGQGSATVITSSYVVIGTCATAGDSVKLPAAFDVNSLIYVKNDGAESCDVFPASGDNLGEGTDTALAVAAGESATFIGTTASNIYTQLVKPAAAALAFPLVVDTGGSAGAPNLAFGDGNTGFYEAADNVLRATIAGTDHWVWLTTFFQGAINGGPMLLDAAKSATVPSFTFSDDSNTGVGSGADDDLSLIAGGLSCLRVGEIAAAEAVGFYTTAPIVLQTGVAVSAAGVHAALVNLGLITA